MADLADSLDAIDNFINDTSDQAAAWYAIVTNRPVVVPSAQITAQTNLATQAPAATLNAPLVGSYVSNNAISLIVLLAAAVAVVFVLKG